MTPPYRPAPTRESPGVYPGLRRHRRSATAETRRLARPGASGGDICEQMKPWPDLLLADCVMPRHIHLFTNIPREVRRV